MTDENEENTIDMVVTDAPAEVAPEIEDAPVEDAAPVVAEQTYNPEAPVAKVVAPSREEIEDALKHFIARGMELSFTRHDENTVTWLLRVGKREASGNVKMPLSQIVWQANLLMAPTATPIEGEDLDTIVKLRASRAR